MNKEEKKKKKEQIVLGGTLVLDSDALLAALHLTIAYKALEDHVSDINVSKGILDDVSDDIILNLKKALKL